MYPYDKGCDHDELKYYKQQNHVVCQECGKVFPETRIKEVTVEKPYPVFYEPSKDQKQTWEPPKTYC